MINRYKKILFKIAALAAILFIFSQARAQQISPQLMITWHAQTYIPSWFHGKALPTANSPITASLELSDSGSIVDLSGYKVYWYVNDELISAGLGLQKINFNSPGVADNTIDLRVEIPSYKSVLKTVEIPVVRPEAVVESPLPNSEFYSVPVELKGWPFFFNIKKSSELNFSWFVNGKSSENSENPEFLTVNINSDAPPGSLVNVGLTVGIPGSLSNIATAGANLIFIK